MVEIGRNDPCPCGSGLKYKKCCWQKNRRFSKSPAASNSLKHPSHFLIFPLIILISILAYTNSFKVPFIFDDGAHITTNRGIHLDDLSPYRVNRLKQTLKEKGRAVAELSFAFNYYLGQLDPFGYHLFNLIVHILTAFGVYFLIIITLLQPSLQGRYESIAFQVATATSLIFAVHTVNTQAVTYIVQRMTSMAALFFIASLLAYIKGRQRHGTPRVIWYITCFISALLAFGTKANTVMLPIFIGLYEVYFFQDLDWQWVKKKLILLPVLLGVPLLLASISIGGNLFQHIFVEGYKTRPFTMAQRVLTQLRVVVYYFSLLFYPHPSRLNLDYDFPLSYSLINPPTTLICFFIIFGLLGLGFYLIKRRPVVSFCIFWFFGNLVIESSIYPLDLVYEHRLYLPSPAFFCLLVMFVIIGIERWISSQAGQKGIKLISLVLVLGILTFWTYQRNQVWHSVISLLEDVVAKSPNKSRQHVNLGVAYSAIGEIDKAIERYKIGIQLDPNYQQTYNNLGNAYNRKGMLDEAIVQYKKAIKMQYSYKEAHNNMGSAYYKKRMYDKAIKEHLIALKIQNDCEKSLNNLGVSYSAKKMYPEAISAFKKAINFKPGFTKPYTNLALAYVAMGQPQNALSPLEQVRRLEPNNGSIYYTFGNAYSDMENHEKAISFFQQAIRLRPNDANSYNNMGLAYRKFNKDEDAIAAYKRAIKFNPRRAEFHYNLGLVYAQTNRHQLAIPSLQQAVALSPGLIRARFDLAMSWEALAQYQDAAKEYETITKRAPNHGQAHHHLGLLYLNQLHNKNKARFHFQRALKLTADSGTKNFLRRQLSRLR